MAFIRATTQGDALKIMLPDGFDLTAGMLLWGLCGLEDQRYRSYLIDFSRVKEIRDSGLAWLMMFKKRVDGSGLQLVLVNLDRRLCDRTRLAGLGPALPSPQRRRRPAVRRPNGGITVPAEGNSALKVCSD